MGVNLKHEGLQGVFCGVQASSEFQCANVCPTFWRGVRLYQRGFQCVCVGWREAIQGRGIELYCQISANFPWINKCLHQKKILARETSCISVSFSQNLSDFSKNLTKWFVIFSTECCKAHKQQLSPNHTGLCASVYFLSIFVAFFFYNYS